MKNILPTKKYLEFSNIFSGSCLNFNYKIFPNVKENKVRVVVFLGEFCFEKSELIAEKNFQFEDDLIEKIDFWLERKKKEI